MNATVERLTTLLKRSEFWPTRENNLVKLLDLFARHYPDPPPLDDINRGRSNESVELSRLNKLLDECFRLDRSLWPGQDRLFIPARGKGDPAKLAVGPLSEILSPTLNFWFSQCVRLPNVQVGDVTNTFIIFSEPLFFFSKRLRAYFRFLDVNHDGPFDPARVRKLTDAAKARVEKALGKDREIPKDRVPFSASLDFVPTRNYIPAGDSSAAVTIRSWFRRRVKHAAGYKEALSVSPADSTKANLIILASRASLPLIADFQERTPELKIRLTEKGIRFGDELLDDEFGEEGYRKARVIVTNWTFDTENVHTYIASNHTRALEAVARMLVNDKLLEPLAEALVNSDGRIPRRFQLAFEVVLQLHETQANEPQLLPNLNGRAVVYRDPGTEGELPSQPARSA